MLPFSRIKHVCFSVDDIEASEKLFAGLLGVASTGINTMVMEGGKGVVKTAFFYLEKGSIELVHQELPPSWKGSPLDKPEGFHHVGFETADFAGALASLAAKGIHPLPGFPMDTGHSRVAFFPPEQTGGVLIELHDAGYGSDSRPGAGEGGSKKPEAAAG